MPKSVAMKLELPPRIRDNRAPLLRTTSCTVPMRNATPFAADRRFDVICLGRFASTSTRSRSAPVSRMSPASPSTRGSSANTAFGCARLGLEAALISARRRRRAGAFPVETIARRMRRQPCRHRSVAPDRRGRGHRRQGYVPADLSARELRRHGDCRGRCRRGLRRAKQGAVDHWHALLDRACRSHQQTGARSRAEERRARSSISITVPCAGD